jgi:hypothetical protein
VGWRWSPAYKITVQIPASPSWAHDQVANSLKVWNQAQLWFAQTYFPDSPVYTLLESSSGVVIVNFVQAEDKFLQDCRVSSSKDAVACNSYKTKLYFDMTYFSSDKGFFQHTSTHEFGHVLGLGHASYNGELMCVNWSVCFHPELVLNPSTLDLYAVHLLASGMGVSSETSVTLPPSIPFEISQIAIPEFENATSLVLLLSILSLTVTVRRRRN